LKRVIDEGAWSPRAIDQEAKLLGDERDVRLLTHLAYGALSWRLSIDAQLERLLRQGLRSLPPMAAHHLRLAFYEIGWMNGRIPHAASAHAAVDAIKLLHGDRIAGVCNGVLRTWLRQGTPTVCEPVGGGAAASLAARWALPEWMAALLLERLASLEEAADVGARADAIARAWTDVSKVHLRQRDERPALSLQGELEAGRMTRHPSVPGAWVVESGFVPSTARLEGLTVQDAGSQLVVQMLPLNLNGPVLDMCSGRGVKALQLQDRYPGVVVVRSDRDERKLRSAGLKGAAVAWDVPAMPAPTAILDLAPFTAILVDAPCTGLGTLGRHPEVKWNRAADDVDALSRVQAEILDAVTPLLAVGGVLVYAVCTWTVAEGPAQVQAYLKRNPNMEVDPPTAESAAADVPWSTLIDRSGGVALMPDAGAWDGFFMARFRRKS
jgi:16S rRNA (cytosine967-C5)-methyltransferase